MNQLYNLDKLNEISQGDEAFVREMIAIFIKNVSEEIIRIQQLVSVEEWTTIAEILHKLASNYAYLNAHKLYMLAVEIEKQVLGEQNVVGVVEKVDQICSDTLLLINILKHDFECFET